jgi:predicted DNA-binding ribbon-helix-helix protein
MISSHPYSHIDLEEITARSVTARHVIAGFCAKMPSLTDFWRHLDTALADNPALSAEVTRLNVELAGARQDTANLLAALRAAIAMHADRKPPPPG